MNAKELNNGIDVSCGDGVYSFLTFGGELSQNTDMFRSIKLGKREDDFDTFDMFDETYQIEVTKSPEISYRYGSDWKENLIKKANKLSFYKNLIVHDNNTIFPFESDYFEFVYSNSAYWVDRFENHVNDLARITKRGGYLVLQMKNRNIFKSSAQNYADFMGSKFHKIVDAGRSSTWKGMRTEEELINVLKSVKGMTIESIEPVYGDLLAKIWDIGLRPLFNPLVKMANNLNEENRNEIKEEWCEIFFDLFEDYLEEYVPQNDVFEYTYVLRKN